MFLYCCIHPIFNPCDFSSSFYSWHILRGAFNKCPDFFVQAFKIVVDSWKLSIVLLYILWDGWPIFTISDSNKQLEQELEYNLLTPDCHSWWISKIQSGCEDTLEERYAIKLCFKLGKNSTETYGMLQIAFGASCMNWASVFELQKRFKYARESVRDDERCGRSREVNTPEFISQRVRVRLRVTMLRFLREFRKRFFGRGQHSLNWDSGIFIRTMHQSTTPSLSQTIWARWVSRQFFTLPIVQTLLLVTCVVLRQLRRWKRMWRRTLTRSN